MKTAFVLILAAAAALGTPALAGDAAVGAEVFKKKCAACHMMGEGAKPRVGPPLTDIHGKAAGLFDGFRYSGALRKAAKAGLVWDDAALDAYLADPRGFLKGTRMSLRPLRDADERADVVAYLAGFSGEPVEAGFTVSAEILAIAGDPDYGQYLSGECTTCHRADGGNDGIPAIVGWETEAFVTAMHAYKSKHRDNPVMQMTAGRLNDEEIAALAAYFGSLGD